jgi:hypothetical protein
MDVKSEILDHANVQTTLQVYVYPSTTSKRDAMEAASMLAGIAKNFYNYSPVTRTEHIWIHKLIRELN